MFANCTEDKIIRHGWKLPGRNPTTKAQEEAYSKEGSGMDSLFLAINL